MNIGFIGLGSMGAAMAGVLLRAGHTVTVWNRSADKAEPLVAQGAIRAATPGEAARGDAVVTMIADDTALEAVMFGDDGILGVLPAGAVHISSSTVSVALAERLSDAHAAKGQFFISAPVFGRPTAAAEGKLFIAAAGAPDAMAKAMPLLETLGQKVDVFGDTPSAANLVKLAGNFLIVSVTETLGEAMALVGKGGVDKAAFLDFLTSTLFGSPIYRNYGALIVSGKFEPAGFAAALGAKDMRLTGEAADSLSVPMPLLDLLQDRLTRLIARGDGHLDLTALAALSTEDAGPK